MFQCTFYIQGCAQWSYSVLCFVSARIAIRLTLVERNAFMHGQDVKVLEHSRMQIVHQTNARIRKCTCRSDRASRLLCAQMRSHSTPVDQNACSMCSDALSLDARQSKCVSYVLRCALARRLPIQMRILCAQMRHLNVAPPCA